MVLDGAGEEAPTQHAVRKGKHKMSDFRQITKNLEKLKERVFKAHVEAVKAGSEQIAKNIIEITPVKTGRLANNWRLEHLRGGHYDEKAKGTKISAQRQIEQDAERLKIDENTKKVYIKNPAPYSVLKVDRRKARSARRERNIKEAMRRAVAKVLKDEDGGDR